VITVELEGVEQLTQRLEALPGKIRRRAMRKPLRATATKIARRLKSGTPRLSGFGQRSVKIKVVSRDTKAWASVKYKGKPAFYLRLYESGSRRQPPRSFFASAVGDYIPDAQREFLDGLKAAVEREEDAAGV